MVEEEVAEGMQSSVQDQCPGGGGGRERGGGSWSMQRRARPPTDQECD